LTYLIAALALAFPAAACAAKDMTGPEMKLVKAINAKRGAFGLPKVKPNRSLAHAANDHSQDMGNNGFFAHTSYNGTDAYNRVMGYTRKHLMGETLAYMPIDGNTRPRHILRLWMNSPSHRSTLLTRKFRRIGVGRTHGWLNGQRVVFWTTDLTSAH
jgi:uncharacterized protein YkwD